MKNRHLTQLVTSIATTFIVAAAYAQPIRKPARSLDYLALSSDRVLVGKVIDFSGEDGWDKKRTIKLSVGETFKGNPVNSITLDATAFQVAKLRDWQQKRERLLAFTPQSSAGIIDLEGASVSACKFDYTVLHGATAILNYVRSVLSRFPGVTKTDSIDLMNPSEPTTKEWQKFYPNSWGLLVPFDTDVDAWLAGMLQSKDDLKVLYALPYIRFFKSDRNIALVKAQLSNPQREIAGPAEYNCGFDFWVYDVRSGAYQLLHDEWHIDIPKPVVNVEISRLASVKEIHLPNRFSVDRLKALEACPNLISVDCQRYASNTYRLGQEQVNAAQIAEIGRFKRLTSIEIAGSESLNDNTLKSLSGLKKLEELDIDQTRLTDASIPTLVAFLRLKTLHIDLTEITDSGIGRFKKLRPDVRLIPPIIHSIVDHYAESNEMNDVARVIGANPNAIEARDTGGNTPLLIACREGFDEMAKMLMKHGARVNALTNNNRSPLEFAADRDDVPLCELLLHQGADINHADSHGDTPLHMAAITCRADIIRLLLKHGANPYAKNADGWTPKEETSSRGAKDMTTLIDDFEKQGKLSRG